MTVQSVTAERALRHIEVGGETQCAALSPRGRYALFQYQTGKRDSVVTTLTLVDLEAATVVETTRIEGSAHAAFFSDETLLLELHKPCTLRLLAVPDGGTLAERTFPDEYGVGSIASRSQDGRIYFRPVGRRYYATPDKRTVWRWLDAESLATLHEVEGSAISPGTDSWSVRLSPDGDAVAFIRADPADPARHTRAWPVETYHWRDNRRVTWEGLANNARGLRWRGPHTLRGWMTLFDDEVQLLVELDRTRPSDQHVLPWNGKRPHLELDDGRIVGGNFDPRTIERGHLSVYDPTNRTCREYDPLVTIASWFPSLADRTEGVDPKTRERNQRSVRVFDACLAIAARIHGDVSAFAFADFAGTPLSSPMEVTTDGVNLKVLQCSKGGVTVLRSGRTRYTFALPKR